MRPKTLQDGARTVPRRSKMAPRRPQATFRYFQGREMCKNVEIRKFDFQSRISIKNGGVLEASWSDIGRVLGS